MMKIKFKSTAIKMGAILFGLMGYSLVLAVPPIAVVHFESTSKKLRVEFVETARKSPDTVTNEDGYIKYELVFRNKAGTELCRTSFANVYVWNSSGGSPKKPTDILKRMVFSPQEDFVILPEEQWERPEGIAIRKIVNLNPKLVWKDTMIRMENERWVGRMMLVGETIQECERSVVAFHGRTHKMKTLLKGDSAAAYLIKGYKWPYLKAISEQSSCPNSTAAHTFVLKRFKIDVRTWLVREIKGF